MSDNETAEDKQTSLIGVDPLAWLSDEEKAAMVNQPKEVASETQQQHEDEQSGSAYTIKLNSALTIRDITELMEELNNIGDDKNELIFESEQVERVDAAAMQLLVGFYLFAVDAGKNVIWDKPSEALCNAVRLLGLNEVINISPSVVA